MTTHKRSECKHCGTPYHFQGSGHGCNTSLNDPSYCTECMGVIRIALSTVKVKYAYRWIDTTDVTEDEMRAALAIEMNPCNEIVIRRVYPALYDSNNNENQNNVKEVNIIGKGTYSISTWTKLGPTVIKKRVLWDNRL